MSTATSNTLLSSVEQFLSMTNPDSFTNEPPQEYVQQLDNATMDLHLNHISNLLTDTKQFSLQPNVPYTPSPPKQSPRKSGLKSPRSSSSSYKKSLPMDSWNMNRSPKKHTHPYLRLYNLLNTKQDRLKWQKQIYTIDEIIEAKCTGWTKYYKGKVTGINRDGSYALEFEDGETKESVKTDQVRALSGRRRTSNRKTKHQIPQRQEVTLRLSSLEKKKRRNESILRKFVDVLKSSRSIYGRNPETLRDLFQTIDIDCNGTIDIAEFEKVITRVGFGLVSKEIIELANAIDDNNDGMIQYNELCTAISSMARQGARRHVEHAKHHLSTASRHVHHDNHNTTTAIDDNFVSKFVEILLNASKSIVQSSEKLRRAFADADESKLGTIAGNVFLNIVIGTGIATGRESDVAKIALGVQNQKGEILYHDFLDIVERKLRKYIQREKLQKDDVVRTLHFKEEEMTYFSNIKSQILEIAVRHTSLPSKTISTLTEFLDHNVDEPSMSQSHFFLLLQNIGITLSSTALLILYSILRLSERSNAKNVQGALDHRAEDARVARMHAINESKLISKFKVMHKQHVHNTYACQVEKIKTRRVETFRLENMKTVLARLNDGNAIEDCFLATLQKIRSTLRMSNDGNNVDIMQVFRLFDTDGDGVVSRSEFIASVELLGCDLTDEEAGACFDMLDPDGSNGISLSEFRYAWFNHCALTRTLPKHTTDDSSMEFQKSVKQNERMELAQLEKMYADKAKLIKSSGESKYTTEGTGI